MLVVLSEEVSPVGLEALNTTVDPNPPRRLRLTIDVAWAPALIERLEGLAERLKSWKTNVTVVVCVILPLAPVIVRVYADADVEEHDMVALPFVAKLVDVMEPQFNPDGVLSVNATVPVKP